MDATLHFLSDCIKHLFELTSPSHDMLTTPLVSPDLDLSVSKILYCVYIQSLSCLSVSILSSFFIISLSPPPDYTAL